MSNHEEAAANNATASQSVNGNEEGTQGPHGEVLDAEGPVSRVSEDPTDAIMIRPLQTKTKEGVDVIFLDQCF